MSRLPTTTELGRRPAIGIRNSISHAACSVLVPSYVAAHCNLNMLLAPLSQRMAAKGAAEGLWISAGKQHSAFLRSTISDCQSDVLAACSLTLVAMTHSRACKLY